MKFDTFIQVVTLPVLVSYIVCHGDVVVESQHGSLRGTILVSERSNKSFFAFMGIPYAKPPVGELRFKAPQPVESWNGTRDATSEGAVCPQKQELNKTYIGDEDCLFLNVYTPELPSDSNASLHPVMVAIHGGGFIYGYGNREVYGPDYLVDSGVIVVTFNYRLGILGFLSLQNEEVPGNNGLKDQVLVLHWVQQNIPHFGGDPNKVTIFGISAGGASVHYHMMSPLSQGLFQQAIIQSGNGISSWAFVYPNEALTRAFSLGAKVGVNTTDPEILLEHLRTVTPQQFQNIPGYSFLPTADSYARSGEVFLPDTPMNMINAGNFSKIPLVIGQTSHEAITLAKLFRHKLDEDIAQVLTTLIPYDLGEVNNTISRAISEKVRDFYFNNSSTANEKFLQYINVLTDNVFVIKTYCIAKHHVELSTAPVYVYEFSFSGAMSLFKVNLGYEDLPGAAHADDLPYLFRTNFENRTFVPGSPEIEASDRTVRLWTNFAKTGNPTPEPDSLLQNVTWNPATESDLVYLDIDSNLTLKHGLRTRIINFWTELYNNYTSRTLCRA